MLEHILDWMHCIVTPLPTRPESAKFPRDTPVGQIGSASSSAPKRLFENSDEDEKEMIFPHANRREERERKSLKLDEDRLKLDEDRLVIERDRVRQEAENNTRLQSLQVQRNQIDERRLDLDECRFELERVEREAQIENTKQLASLLSKLADKLN